MGIPGVPKSIRHVIAETTLLWPLSSMRIGGPARWLAEPESERELVAILAWIRLNHLPYLILGAGTNVLFPNEGFAGVVILTRQLNGFQVDGTMVTAACGENLASFARHLNRVGLSGLEWACGIPGTIGGAVVMNAGAFGRDLETILSNVRILEEGRIRELRASELAFGYRSSAIRSGEISGVVLEATFSLRQEDVKSCQDRAQRYADNRRRTQPIGASCGSVFKNPPTGPTAGELLDQAGCKSMRVGHAVVSDLHANFILNEGENNAGDVFELIERMLTCVKDFAGVTLALEAHIASST